MQYHHFITSFYIVYCSLFIVNKNVKPPESDSPKCQDLVVAYGRWSLGESNYWCLFREEFPPHPFFKRKALGTRLIEWQSNDCNRQVSKLTIPISSFRKQCSCVDRCDFFPLIEICNLSLFCSHRRMAVISIVGKRVVAVKVKIAKNRGCAL